MTNTTKDQLRYARKLLDDLKRYDRESNHAHYEMGRLLSSIEHGQLYELLGYNSMSALIEEELSISPSKAYKLLQTFRRFRALKFSKTEAIEAINEHSFTNMALWLQTATQKPCKRTLRKQINDLRKRQLNFLFHDPETYDHVVQTLIEFGCVRNKRGALKGSSDALLAIIDTASAIKAKERENEERRRRMRVVAAG